MTRKAKNPPRNKYARLALQTALGIFDVLVSIFLAFLLTFIYFYTNTSEVTEKKFEMNETSIIYDRSGKHVLYKIFGEENRKVLSHDEIPDTIRWATIAAEDDNFYHHFGIDIKSSLRAARENLKAENIEQGASTITQQLARNVFLTREKTFKRKIKEAVLAIKIERIYSKDEILDMYLNKVPYGANAYGIQAAAQTYFKKDAKDLTLDEASLLAILPNAPSLYLPYGENIGELVKKQRKIIERTRELGLVSGETAEKALNENIEEKIQPLNRDIKAPHFVMYVLEKMESEYGRDFLEKGGLRIITSLDWEKQMLAEEILKNSKDHLNRYGATNASLVAIDPKTGQILAMAGSLDYFDKSIDGQVNVSLRERQPGSSFKPIVYAKAFEKGFQPETLLFDARTNFGPDGSGKDYIPRNYDGKFHGRVSMRQALAMSLNIPAVQTLYLAGIPETIELAKRLGVTTLNDD
ncbi:MAG: transglycosylase domain-containing protein, partial [Candidatus Moranbacteria bacterium]|nr:transglycosylase domain-containing protein [Candidatus Moranbacteria bacterium]